MRCKRTIHPNTQKPAIRLPEVRLGVAATAALRVRSSRALLCPGAPFSKLRSLRRSAACVGSSYTTCKPVLIPSSGAALVFEVTFSGSSLNAYEAGGIFAGGICMPETLVPMSKLMPTLAPAMSDCKCGRGYRQYVIMDEVRANED